jgi:hypothetical protein
LAAFQRCPPDEFGVRPNWVATSRRTRFPRKICPRSERLLLAREADVNADKDSVTIKSGRFVQLGSTKEGKQTQT